MTDFSDYWKFATRHGSFQQEYKELEHIYNIMKECGCKSYLEVGAAEGGSMSILGYATDTIDYIDIAEPHTEEQRNEVIAKLRQDGKIVTPFHGDSGKPETHIRKIARSYDCVLIDGAHDYTYVLSDSMLYAPMASKYVFWHDIQLPEVQAAVKWFTMRWKIGEFSTFINTDRFGYGIMKVNR